MARKGKRSKKVKCSDCGQPVALNSQGLIKAHTVSGRFRYQQMQCSGTHKKPS
ncbi:hypothetical protein JW977_00465 [Candidatus Falkowbacteria bacterium]|nr:hypothetical protein [Candidatus Falkowbacteria bacterium]